MSNRFGIKDSISKKIILDELEENSHIEKVEDVIFWALEHYAETKNATNGALVAYAIKERIRSEELIRAEEINKPLHLNLKKEWFDLIRSGKKKEEYREVSHYWANRLLDKSLGERYFKEIVEMVRSENEFNLAQVNENIKAYDVHTDIIEFRNGYQANSPRILVEYLDLSIDYGKPEWGAEQGRLYFVLKLGDIIEK